MLNIRHREYSEMTEEILPITLNIRFVIETGNGMHR
jgi:hypothetical protein